MDQFSSEKPKKKNHIFKILMFFAFLILLCLIITGIRYFISKDNSEYGENSVDEQDSFESGEIKNGLTEKTADAGNEEEMDYHLMALKCKDIIDEYAGQGLFEDNGYAFDDVDKDGVPEFIVQKGTCNADFEYAVYCFDGEELREQGKIPYGNIIFGYPVDKVIDVQYVHMGYEIIFRYDLREVQKISERNLNETDVTGYEFPAEAYKIEMYHDFSYDDAYSSDFIYDVLVSAAK